MGGQPLILLGADPVAEVVDDVVSAPQDPVIGREPVIVKLIAEIGQALPALPADGVLLLRREGFGDQDIVVDRHDVVAEPTQQIGEGVRGQRYLPSPDRAERQRSARPAPSEVILVTSVCS